MRCVPRRFDRSTDPGDLRRVDLLLPWLIRVAAQTGTESCTLRVGRRAMEAHVSRIGPARGTGRPAIHPRRDYGVIERAVGATIACNHSWPSRVAFCRHRAKLRRAPLPHRTIKGDVNGSGPRLATLLRFDTRIGAIVAKDSQRFSSGPSLRFLQQILIGLNQRFWPAMR